MKNLRVGSLLTMAIIILFLPKSCDGEAQIPVPEAIPTATEAIQTPTLTATEEPKGNYGNGGILLDCPPPKEGYELAGFTYVLDFAVQQMSGVDTPSAGGYVFVRTKTTVKESEVEHDEIVSCVYNPITPPKTYGISLECPKPKTGYYLVGFTYVVNNQVEDYWGKDTPAAGGYVFVRSNTKVEDHATKYDEIVACIYDPIKPPQTLGISLECPAPKQGFYLAGFSYMVDYEIQSYWGKDEASEKGYVFVNTETNVVDGVAHDEVVLCVYEPIESLGTPQEPQPVIDPQEDWFDYWEGKEPRQGPAYTDITSAQVTQVNSDLVFTMELADAVPYPDIPGAFELEYFFALCPIPNLDEWPWHSPAFDGLECQPNAFSILMYADGIWRFGVDYAENGAMKTIDLPEDNLLIEDNKITFKVPSEAIGNPSSFKWLAGTYADGAADIAPDEGAVVFFTGLE